MQVIVLDGKHILSTTPLVIKKLKATPGVFGTQPFVCEVPEHDVKWPADNGAGPWVRPLKQKRLLMAIAVDHAQQQLHVP